MTSPDNILLHLVKEQEEQIRGIFAALDRRGLPKQNQTPHITVSFAPEMSDRPVQRAAELLPAVIPASFRRMGVVVFGTKSKQTIAWLLEGSEEMEAAAREISGVNPDGRGARWTPHLTMGLRIPRAIVPEYIAALDEETSPHFKEITADRGALWRPRLQELTVFAGRPGKNGQE